MMSRICVKNLPKQAAEERLKELFSQKGEVTDAKLIRTKDGKSRQFGFVGFRTEEEARDAIKFFNNSFIDTCRITCEIARKIGDQDLPRPWSKYTWQKLSDKGKEANGKKDSGVSAPRGQGKNSKINVDDDPLLREYLEVMKPRSTLKFWASDTSTVASLEKTNIASNRNIKARIGQDKSNVTEAKLDDLLSRSDKERPLSVVHNTGVSDVDYLKSRIKEKWSDSDSDKDDDSGTPHDDTDKLCRPGYLLPCSNNDMDGNDKTTRLMIINIPFSTTEEELEKYLSKFGNVLEVHIVVNKETKMSKGYGFVRITFTKSAARAFKDMEEESFQGRPLYVKLAKQKTSEKQEMNTLLNGSSKSFKRQKEEERKEAETSGNTQAWNPFYMRSDTVMEYIARKIGVRKTDFLDEEADDLAVRTALVETQVIAETKKAFVKAGVNITSLEKFAACRSNNFKRSSHVILVKNLPYGSSEAELAVMFERFGSLDKIILPPTNTLALIIFLEPSEARVAFNSLRYTRYKDIPLYLEWAPSNILAADDTENKTIVGEDEVKKVQLEQEVEGLMDPHIDHDRIESPSLYVKNLNFKTSDESLKAHFAKLVKGQILSVRVQKHEINNKIVSAGYGFIEFDSVDAAVNICRDQQGTVLDRHALILQPCHAKEGRTAKKVENDESSTKLIIRNVAFEATKDNLMQLCSTFGQIKRLSLPIRYGTGHHRGFAFVEYMTKQEAQNALHALANTHLYDRHLVVERAKEAESLEELRARTAAQFSEVQRGLLTSTKMSRKRKNLGRGFDELQ